MAFFIHPGRPSAGTTDRSNLVFHGRDGMRSSRHFLFGILFVVLATALTLAVGEGLIRVISSVRLIYNIEMVKYARSLKIRDPKGEVSHVHRPNASAHLMGVDIALNSLGNRGPELAAVKGEKTRRILVMGSSITMGWGVPWDKVFTTVTQERLNREKPFGPEFSFEIANAGIGNYNTHFQSHLFRTQYPAVKPDMVVLHYFISDVQPRSMGRDNPILKHSYLAAFLFDRWSQLRLRLTGKFKDLFTFYNDLYRDDSPAWAETRRQIVEMRDLAARDKVPFFIMIIPDIHDLTPGSPYGALYQKMEAAFRSEGIPTLNTFDRFQQRFGGDVTQLWIQGDDPHPNASGHALMAELLFRYLVEQDPMHLKKRE